MKLHSRSRASSADHVDLPRLYHERSLPFDRGAKLFLAALALVLTWILAARPSKRKKKTRREKEDKYARMK